MPEINKPAHPTRVFHRNITHRATVDAFNRLSAVREGQSQVFRFSLGERIEHFLLLTAVFVLAVTGLAQTFDATRIGQTVLILLGGLDGAQQIHHLFSMLLMGTGLYHGMRVLDGYLVKRKPARMLPSRSDLRNIFRMFAFNLGLSKKLPLFDRYSFDEKFIYWVTVIAVVVLSLTGLVMWFPINATQVLPGSFFLFSGLIHRWQAIFIVVVMLFLHLYQVLVRKRNLSIFTGKMTVKEMQIDHPVEMAYLEQAASLSEIKSLPRTVKFIVEEAVVEKAHNPAPVPPAGDVVE